MLPAWTFCMSKHADPPAAPASCHVLLSAQQEHRRCRVSFSVKPSVHSTSAGPSASEQTTRTTLACAAVGCSSGSDLQPGDLPVSCSMAHLMPSPKWLSGAWRLWPLSLLRITCTACCSSTAMGTCGRSSPPRRTTSSAFWASYCPSLSLSWPRLGHSLAKGPRMVMHTLHTTWRLP